MKTPRIPQLFLIVVLLSALVSGVQAATPSTDVGGPIISDTTWTLAQSPYIVVTHVDVWQGVTLTIEPGVVVKFNKDKFLQVNGTLVVRGTPGNLVTFTSNQPSPAKGDWGNIAFTGTAITTTMDVDGNYIRGSVLQYCLVEYGGANATYPNLGAISADSLLIDHCIVRNNKSYGISGGGTASAPGRIANNTVTGNSGGGIRARENTFVTGNTVSGNSVRGGIYSNGSTVTGNIVSGNSALLLPGLCDDGPLFGDTLTEIFLEIQGGALWGGGGIRAFRGNISHNIVHGNTAGVGGGIFAEMATVHGNSVDGNTADCLGGGVFGWNGWGGVIDENEIWGNTARYMGGGIYAYQSVTVQSNTVYRNTNGGIAGIREVKVNGNIVIGNSDDGSGGIGDGGGIYAEDSTVTGNTVSGNLARDVGGGIYANNSPVISNTVIANSLYFTSGQGTGVYFSGGRDFLYNTIVDNTTISPTTVSGGVAIDGTPNFHHNNLYGNTNYDVVVLKSGDISGTHNFWGTVATVDILAHVYDWYDNTSRGRLLFVPYIQDPDPASPVPPPLNLRASFSGASVNLTWDPIPSITMGYGYKVYYDNDASGPPYQGTGATQGDAPIDVGNATHFTLNGLSGATHIAVTAYDNRGRESWYSNEAVGTSSIYLPLVLNRR